MLQDILVISRIMMVKFGDFDDIIINFLVIVVKISQRNQVISRFHDGVVVRGRKALIVIRQLPVMIKFRRFFQVFISGSAFFILVGIEVSVFHDIDAVIILGVFILGRGADFIYIVFVFKLDFLPEIILLFITGYISGIFLDGIVKIVILPIFPTIGNLLVRFREQVFLPVRFAVFAKIRDTFISLKRLVIGCLFRKDFTAFPGLSLAVLVC